jgi:hypothetical protein
LDGLSEYPACCEAESLCFVEALFSKILVFQGHLRHPSEWPPTPFFPVWPGRAARKPMSASVRVEEIQRFTIDFDEATIRHTAWPEFWCPHNADLLNCAISITRVNLVPG